METGSLSEVVHTRSPDSARHSVFLKSCTIAEGNARDPLPNEIHGYDGP